METRCCSDQLFLLDGSIDNRAINHVYKKSSVPATSALPLVLLKMKMEKVGRYQQWINEFLLKIRGSFDEESFPTNTGQSRGTRSFFISIRGDASLFTQFSLINRTLRIFFFTPAAWNLRAKVSTRIIAHRGAWASNLATGDSRFRSVADRERPASHYFSISSARRVTPSRISLG